MAAYRPDVPLFEQQLRSIAQQTEGNFHCLIGFDGPDGDGVSFARSIVGADDRFTVAEFPANVGVYRHFERLLKEVPDGAPWIALSDQDDRWLPDKLERMLPHLPVSGAVVAQARVVDDAQHVLRETTARHPTDLPGLFLQNEVTGALTVLTPEVVRLSIPFPDTDSPVAMHDHWLAVVAAAVGTVVMMPDVVQDYVQHRDNLIGEARPTSVSEWRGQIRSAGGWQGYMGARAGGLGQWRLAMSRALRSRGLAVVAVPGQRGGLYRTTRSALSAARHRRMRVRGAVGAVLDAVTWSWASRESTG